MSTVPTEFPDDDPQDLAAVELTQVHETLTGLQEAAAGLRAKYGEAIAETTVEFQAIKALESAIPLLTSLANML